MVFVAAVVRLPDVLFHRGNDLLKCYVCHIISMSG
jgi:hypothetical protein